MAINLSDLTNASTSGDILAEAQTTADFLDSVPLLKNLADPSGATDAKQFTATKQPTALPLIDNEGYCYLPPVTGNYASTPDSSELDITGDITLECDFIVPEFPLGENRALVGKYNTSTNNRSYLIYIQSNGNLGLNLSQNGNFLPSWATTTNFSSVLSGKTRATVKVTWRQSDGRVQFFIKESDGSFTQVGVNQTIAATSIHSSNQEVEIGTTDSGDSFSGSSLGVFGARIYASVDGTDKRLDVDFTSPRIPHGASKFTCETGQVVTVNTSGNNPAKIIKKPVLRFDGVDDFMKGLFSQSNTEGGYAFAVFSVHGNGGETWGRVLSFNPTGSTDSTGGGGDIFIAKNNDTNDILLAYTTLPDLFDSTNGDILVESTIGSDFRKRRVNNASASISYTTNTILYDEFNLGGAHNGNGNTSIDLEYLALFPATLTDKQADQVRNYINNRNKVFDRWDTDGYYFYNPQDLSSGAVTTWNGRITGSDNGDVDKLATQATAADQPTSDGYKVTFADNTDHFDIPSTTQAGWQVVGTSLGTFAYKVNANAVTELNMLGNAGIYRASGDLYGIILLPESATNRDIEETRKLLIDRGASDGTSNSSIYRYFDNRRDIVEFKYIDTSSVTGLAMYVWRNCVHMTSFPALDLSNSNNFTSAWQNCSALKSFPVDAKLGTEASYVDFTNAWRDSGLTSFSTPLPTAATVSSAWSGCSSLTNFSADVFSNWNPSSILSGVFNDTWDGCTSLTAQSVENILVSINSSGKHGTSDGTSGGTPLSDAGIDIDYDGSGLTAATTAAISSLKSKGWSIFINSVEQ